MNQQLPILNMSDLVATGEQFAMSGMFGGISASQGFVIACHLHTTAMSSIEFTQKWHVVGDKVSMKADAMLAGIVEHGGKHKIIDRDSERAAIELIDGRTKQKFELTWDVAKEEPFTKKKDGVTITPNYATPHKRMQMLWARVTSDAVRAMFPQVCAGSYTPEEVDDFAGDGDGIEDERDETLDQDVPQATETQTAPQEMRQPPEHLTPNKPAQTQPATGPEPTPFPEVNFEVCPLPDVPMTGQRWDTLDKEILQQALGIQDPSMLPGHFDAINAILAN